MRIFQAFPGISKGAYRESGGGGGRGCEGFDTQRFLGNSSIKRRLWMKKVSCRMLIVYISKNIWEDGRL